MLVLPGTLRWFLVVRYRQRLRVLVQRIGLHRAGYIRWCRKHLPGERESDLRRLAWHERASIDIMVRKLTNVCEALGCACSVLDEDLLLQCCVYIDRMKSRTLHYFHSSVCIGRHDDPLPTKQSKRATGCMYVTIRGNAFTQ